jgi:hypothetical protein
MQIKLKWGCEGEWKMVWELNQKAQNWGERRKKEEEEEARSTALVANCHPSSVRSKT